MGPKVNVLIENTTDAPAMSPTVWTKPLCTANFHILVHIHTVTLIFPKGLMARKYRFTPLNNVSLDSEIFDIFEN